MHYCPAGVILAANSAAVRRAAARGTVPVRCPPNRLAPTLPPDSDTCPRSAIQDEPAAFPRTGCLGRSPPRLSPRPHGDSTVRRRRANESRSGTSAWAGEAIACSRSPCSGARARTASPWPTPTRTAATPVPAISMARPSRDFRDILARPDIDAAVVATPDYWHVPIAIAAARAEEGRLHREAVGNQHRARPRPPSLPKTIASSNTARSSGASAHCRFGGQLVRSGRIGTVHAIEVIVPNGGGSGRRPVACAAESGLRHVVRPRRPRPIRPTAAIPTGPTGSMTIRSAISAAGPPIPSTSWFGAATPTSPAP